MRAPIRFISGGEVGLILLGVFAIILTGVVVWKLVKG